ncbi:Large ribosomal subunit protein mL44 [Nakaseomyces bracarensis]|uniref:Large ribosomal subunit protein mL44 n=1 Tax=Nakaseomyces bracarensis TaxID=273131 RepID=A0ABR4NXX8_9SACH
MFMQIPSLARNCTGAVRYLRSFASVRQLSTATSKVDTAELDRYRVYYNGLKKVVDEIPEEVAVKSPALIALHRRLNLPQEFTYSSLARCLTCRTADLPSRIANPFSSSSNYMSKAGDCVVPTKKGLDNHGLNIFGKNLLTYEVTQFLIKKYPRLPIAVLNAAVDAYLSQSVLANIGKTWGIEPENTPVVQRYLANEPYSVTLGKLRFFNNSLNREDGLILLSAQNFSEDAAYSLAVRSIIAALWSSTQNTPKSDSAVKFIHDHILSRKLDVTKIFMFENPTRELAALCRRETLEKPISKLIAESGRHSKAPVFIVGVFSGGEKLGEGYGASLKEAKARAASDALLKWYCYEPTTEQSLVIDHGAVIV